ncbi:endothelin-converting enzyme-like 1 [Dermacentor silvarum]|uniref:endothelin-converting enzyme-like 1 n=1 Tax=Dermacentor silvarum TaxID=543639 RepID=UPI002100E086|nr:endothelin-converting enzyme-like 1 [Dermacentor silvarum]
MFRRTGDQVQLKNAAMVEPGTSTSYSSSSSSSSSSSGSDMDAFGGHRRITRPARRPGFQRLELHELYEVRQMQAAARRAADAEARGDGAGNALDPLALPEPALMNQERNGAEVVVRPGNWYMNQRFQAALSTTAILCSVALLVYLGSTLWIRIKYRDLLRASTRKAYAEHADLPLFSGCDEMACQLYMAAIRSSINKSQDPCQNFYGFVCDGWKHQHRLLSVVDAAQDTMYKRALTAIKRVSQDSHNQAKTASSAMSVEKKVAALAKSCMELSESSLEDLKRFMFERHLPWPERSRWDPLAILLDLSGNWNVHLWFQVNIRLSPFRVGSTEPVLKIVPSAAFRSWMATMRAFAGHPTGSTPSLHYRRYVRKMLRLFGGSESASREIVSTIEAMNKLTLETLGPAMNVPEPRIVRMSIRNLTETGTLRIATGRMVLLFNELFMWARRFSASDMVQVENLGLLRSVVYILGLEAETQEALTLSLGLRVAHELGWMAHRGIADVTLELAGLPRSAHTRRCLVQIESTVGVGWLSLFPKHEETESFVRDVRDVLIDAVARRSKAFLQLRAHSTSIPWNSDSFLASVLPEPSRRARFFIDWLNLMVGRWRLQEQDITNVLKPGSLLSHRWSFQGALTVAEDYFVFPFYHSDLPPAVNYGGAGRLIADEVLRGLFHELAYNQSQNRNNQGRTGFIQHSNYTLSPDWPPYHVDTKALLAALSAYRLAVVQDLSSAYARLSSLAQDRLFFVSSCYTLCSSSHYVDPLYGDARRRCNEPVKQLSEFAAAFRCKAPFPKL